MVLLGMLMKAGCAYIVSSYFGWESHDAFADPTVTTDVHPAPPSVWKDVWMTNNPPPQLNEVLHSAVRVEAYSVGDRAGVEASVSRSESIEVVPPAVELAVPVHDERVPQSIAPHTAHSHVWNLYRSKDIIDGSI